MYDAFESLMNAGRKAPLAPWTRPSVPKAIARPAPTLSYDSPAVTTSPAYQQPAYQAPYQAPYQQAAIAQPGNVTGGGGEATTPAAPVKPKLSEADLNEMAEVDSTFMDQKSMYANALKKYIEDYGRQKTNLELDASTAQTGIARNREVGLTGLSEDFASRGLANSGMFADNLDKADTQYDKQKENVTTGLTNSIGDLNFRKAKYEAENGANGTNVQAARREAYARLAAAQNLT